MDASLTLPAEILRPLQRTGLAIVVGMSAIFLWAWCAPLTTTLSLQGRFLSDRPSLMLQHPYGGQVAEVLVARHDRVAAGELLMRLNVELDQAQLAATEARAAQLQQENLEIANLLNGDGRGAGDTAVALQHAQAVLQQRLKQESQVALKAQAAALEQKIALTKDQLTLMKARAGRQTALLDKGLMRRNDGEVLAEQILIVEAEIQSDLSALHAMRDRIQQANHGASLIMLKMREQLEARRDANARQIDDLQQVQLTLADRVQQAEIRAPWAGVVSEISLEAGESYAAKGATLVQLSQPLQAPFVSFIAPVGHVDQLQVGQRGRLIVPSLPQRMLPQIDVEVAAIAPRASLDEAGNPSGYHGRAEVSAAGLEALQKAMETQLLPEDMPVQIVVAVRDTTFAEYLLDPLRAAFRNALQD